MVWMPPAACHEEPDVTSSRSSSTASFQPYLARWNRIEQPTTPPPTTTTFACVGSFLVPLVSSICIVGISDLSHCGIWSFVKVRSQWVRHPRPSAWRQRPQFLPELQVPEAAAHRRQGGFSTRHSRVRSRLATRLPPRFQNCASHSGSENRTHRDIALACVRCQKNVLRQSSKILCCFLRDYNPSQPPTCHCVVF